MALEKKRVCVVDLGHLGLVTSVCLADLSYKVVGVDPDGQKVRNLNRGIPFIFEPGLKELLAAHINTGRLTYTTQLAEGVRGAEYVLLSQDTPVDEEDEVDLSGIWAITSQLDHYLEDGSIVIVNSQVPVGTCHQIEARIRAANPRLEFGLAYSPENLRLGEAIQRFKQPDMIVIGSDSQATLRKVEQFYGRWGAPIITMELRSAEMTKHALNCYLATCISLINEIANLSDRVGADAVKVSQALRLDSRVSRLAPLKPGLGFSGGHLSRDLKVLLHLGELYGYQATLVKAVLDLNEYQKAIVVRQLQDIFGSLDNLKVGVLGLTYKPGTNSLHRSASLEIIQLLASQGAKVRAYDPKADPEEVKLHHGFAPCPDAYRVAEGSQALALLTPWPEFLELDWARLHSLMEKPVLLDPQNALDAQRMRNLGFLYYGVGRGQLRAS